MTRGPGRPPGPRAAAPLAEQPGAAALLLAAALLAAAPARAQPGPAGGQPGPARPRPGEDLRPLRPVVVPGAELGPALGAALDDLRLFAVRAGRLAPIPFQVDERAPDGAYCLDRGSDRRSDVDEGLLDDDDELVLMARDAGPRRAADDRPPGPPPAALVELALVDARGRALGWVYLARYAGAPPPPSSAGYVALDWAGDDLLGWTGERAQVRCAPGGANALDLRALRFRGADGALGPNALERAVLRLRASYTFLNIERPLDELRAAPVAWRDGPVRAIVRLAVETYLIWGHWVRAGPVSRLVVYGDRAELALDVRVPVPFEPGRPSDLLAALELAAPPGGATAPLRAWTDRNPRPLRAGARRPVELDRTLPRWLCVGGPRGAVVLRLALDPTLARPGHALVLHEGPARAGGPAPLTAGWWLDLQALPQGRYPVRVTLQLGPPVAPGDEGALLEVDDVPVHARRTDGG